VKHFTKLLLACLLIGTGTTTLNAQTTYTFAGSNFCISGGGGANSVTGNFQDLRITATESGNNTCGFGGACVTSSYPGLYVDGCGLGNAAGNLHDLTVAKTNGSAFTPTSVDFTPISYPVFNPPYENAAIVIRGYNGNTLVGTITINTTNSGVSIPINFSSYSGFTNITSLYFTAGAQNFYINNLILGAAQATNTAPNFTNATNTLTVCRNAAATDISNLLRITDVDASQTETFTVSTPPNHGGTITLGTTVGSGTNVSPTGWKYTPASNYSGTETFTIQVSDGTATATKTITVTINAVPSPNLSISSTAVCGGPVSITALGCAGTITFSSVGGNGSASGNIYTYTTVGTYTLTATCTDNGCLSPPSSPASVTISSVPNQPVIAAVGPATVCAGTPLTIGATTACTIGLLTYTYASDDNPIPATATPGDGRLVLTRAGAYTVSAACSTPSGCTGAASAAIRVQINTNPTVTITGGNVAICAGQSVTLGTQVNVASVSASPYTYLWMPGPVSQNNAAGTAVVQPATTTAYTVKVTDANSCTVVSSPVSVSVNALPTVNILPTSATLTCATTSVTLTASATGATGYTLSNGQSNTTGLFVVSTPGPYTVTMSNANGCTATASATVVSNTTAPSASLMASSLTFCSGGAVTLTASGGTGYAFSGPGLSQSGASTTATASQGGNYSVVVSGTNGCTASAGVSLTANLSPSTPTLTSVSRTLTASPVPLPLSQFVSAAGVLSFSGVSGFLNPPNADISQPGVQSFSVSQTNANSCTSLATPFSLTVLVYPPGNQTVCRSSSVVLTVGLPGSRYEWYKNGQSAPFKLTEIASIQKGTATSSLTIVSVQTTANYYCKVFQADGSSGFAGPFQVAVNYGCIAPGARLAAEPVVEVPLAITLMPNPLASGQLRAVVRGAGGVSLSVELVDLRGGVVRSQTWPVADEQHRVEWDITVRPSGLYLLRATANGKSQTVNVIKPD